MAPAPAMLDTSALNRGRQDLRGRDSVWLFGYGSLIHKVDFPCIEARAAAIRGWERRFWQGSQDHRGTPAAPGRVLTLIPVPGARCGGMAYRVRPEVFTALDQREKNGYLRFTTQLEFRDGSHAEGIVYIAEAGNPAWLGPASDLEIARHIARSRGPSGSNRAYLLQLAAALRELGEDDPHVFALEATLLALDRERGPEPAPPNP